MCFHQAIVADEQVCMQNGTVKSTGELVKTLNAGSIGDNVGTHSRICAGQIFLVQPPS